MNPTRPLLLVGLVALGVAAGWSAARLLYPAVSPLPPLAPATLVLLALAEAFSARLLAARRRGAVGTRPVHPIDVARTAALARASSAAGALVAGAYAGLALHVRGLREALAVADGDLLVAALSAAAGLLLVAAALLLERTCRVRPGPRDP